VVLEQELAGVAQLALEVGRDQCLVVGTAPDRFRFAGGQVELVAQSVPHAACRLVHGRRIDALVADVVDGAVELPVKAVEVIVIPVHGEPPASR